MDLHGQLTLGVAQLGLELSETQMNQLVAYVELMAKWNKTYNLTSVRDPKDMLNKHILDSLAVVPFIEAKNYIDVGTGPGLPGIPLAIACSDTQFTCLDSLGKRVRFMKQVVFELGLTNVMFSWGASTPSTTPPTNPEEGVGCARGRTGAPLLFGAAM